ncbi:MAG: hypothetical protein NTW19_00650 [Planctomycetota bacterium]|nr:hypothetical protein [Planctomycetota bacterium]
MQFGTHLQTVPTAILYGVFISGCMWFCGYLGRLLAEAFEW